MYPWKTTRIQELPDVNNNGGFDIPFSPDMKRETDSFYSGGGRKTVTMGARSGHHVRPDLKRTPIHSRTSDSTKQLTSTENLFFSFLFFLFFFLGGGGGNRAGG